jgi:hypothetical protein
MYPVFGEVSEYFIAGGEVKAMSLLEKDRRG